ncbi:MAG: CoA ester lyase [Burkholderiales bacterium]
MKRSYLFVPGNRPERFAKAFASGASAVILDLEDAVPPEGKPAARESICEWLRQHDGNAWVRVNATDTEFFEDDMRAVAAVPHGGVMLPKAESAEEVRHVARLLGAPTTPVIPLIESAVGLWSALGIAQSPQVERLAFGSVDFQLDTGIQDDDAALLFARSQLVIISRIARIVSPIDGVTTQIDDGARLKRDVARARALGFGAKLCIHPNQIAAVEHGFAPSDEEVRWARAVVSAFERAAGGAVRLDGKLIDLPVVERARRLLAEPAASRETAGLA